MRLTGHENTPIDQHGGETEGPEASLLKVVNAGMVALRQDLNEHLRLLLAVLENRALGPAQQPDLGTDNGRRREQRYRLAIQQAITVLEESRKAFKFRQLGDLRKQLINVLMDAQIR